MKTLVVPLLLVACILGGCKPIKFGFLENRESTESRKSTENITAEERAAAKKLQRVKDPISEEIYAANVKTRQAYNNRRFDELEKQAAELRASKEVFGNGSWKLVQFYESFACRDNEPDSMWQLHVEIHEAWIAARPESISARIAYADFLADYAWRARGSGYANTVTREGWRLFEERLKTAREVLHEARALEQKDPCWWLSALTVALGQGWDHQQYRELLDEAHAFEPKFWGYDTSRAYSLLPRWHGKEGDWEAYAEESATRANGLGAEIYGRIAMRLRGFYENIFRETDASWPRTKEGLEQMLKKYPESVDLLSNAAILATMAEDRVMAKELFDRLGDRYLPSVWDSAAQLIHYRHWAETGVW